MFIYGAEKHGSVVLSVARELGEEVLAFVDCDSPDRPSTPPVFDTLDVVPPGSKIIVAIGDNSVRRRVVGEIRASRPDLRFATLVHPTATLMDGVEVAPGTVIMPNVTVGAFVRVGEHCILNSGSVLEHHSCMQDFSRVGPGAATRGSVHTASGTFVCIRAAIKHGVYIGPDNVIGACSYVHRDVRESNAVLYGTPARLVRKRAPGDLVL